MVSGISFYTGNFILNYQAPPLTQNFEALFLCLELLSFNVGLGVGDSLVDKTPILWAFAEVVDGKRTAAFGSYQI